MIQYICDGCDVLGGEEIQTVGKDRHYCPRCFPHIEAFLRKIHSYLEQTAREYRKVVKEFDEELHAVLPTMKRAPVVDQVLLKIEDRE